MKFRAFFLLAAPFLASASAQAADVDEHLALKSYTAFKCHVYAAQSLQTEESQRLFRLGFKSGKDFLEILEDGIFASEVVNDTVPGVVMEMVNQGLTNEEFVLGRIYENTRREAFDDVIKKSAAGFELPPNQWRRDDQSKGARAMSLYKEANCALLK